MNGIKKRDSPVFTNGQISDGPGTQLLVEADSGNSYVVMANEEDDHDDEHAHFDPSAHSTLRLFILVGALALHAVFEGLVFGISQESAQQMFGTIMAVVIHKSIIAFSTGMQLLSSKIETKNLIIAISIFSAMAPFGLIIGLIISSLGTDGSLDGPIIVLEALATGTFIYVTFLELVPHEFMGDVKNGPVKVFVMALGFATMAAFQLMDYDVVFIKPIVTG